MSQKVTLPPGDIQQSKGGYGHAFTDFRKWHHDPVRGNAGLNMVGHVMRFWQIKPNLHEFFTKGRDRVPAQVWPAMGS
jgi:hypothetical protein